MKLLALVLAVLSFHAADGVLTAQEGRNEPSGHPRYFAGKVDDIGVHGHEWTAASAALTSDGSVKSSGINWRLREGLEWQLQRGAVANGLKEGEVPVNDDWCAPHRSSRGIHVQNEQDGRFSSALLLSEVAVTATLKAAAPGFFTNGNPGVMFSLSDVVPLHSGSEPVDHVLVPFDRLVIRDRVFCAVTPSESRWSRRSHPGVGDRVVILGERGERGVVRTGAWWSHLGYLALVDDNEALHWDSLMHERAGRPGSLPSLRLRVEEAVSGGLFNMTAHLVSLEYGSPERVQFTRMLRRNEPNGCRVTAAALSEDGHKWMPERIVCPPER